MRKNLIYFVFKVILPWMAILFHLYVCYVAFKEGVLSLLLTFFLPFISEIYWVIKLWGTGSPLITIFWIVLIGGIISGFIEEE